jgi:ubiquinone/menaquinone biosynthesis C-methylase UbiE
MPSHQRDYPQDLAAMAGWVSAHARPGQRVLDIGCGDGSLVDALHHSVEVIGIDPSAEPGEYVRAVALEDFDSAPFDVVFASLSLHHLHDLDAAAQALRRLTAEDGVVLVREFDRVLLADDVTLRWWFHQRQAVDVAVPESDHDHPLPSTYDEFRSGLFEMLQHHVHPWADVAEMLTSAGLTAMDQHAVAHLFRWGLDESILPAEEALIAQSVIKAIGVRWTGRR